MKQTVKTSRAAGQLEKMFRELNKHYFAGKLPEPIISLKKTPSAYGHITCSKVWQAGGENKYEINISSATLDRPIEETASTLLHEMVHEHCMETGIILHRFFCDGMDGLLCIPQKPKEASALCGVEVE